MIFFVPFVKDKYKFTNKGFRYFSFDDAAKEANTMEDAESAGTSSNTSLQLNSSKMTKASKETVDKVKEVLKKMGAQV